MQVKTSFAEKFNEAYLRLNPQQLAAVDTIEGPVMVIAGPGTGKTQVLALRIVNILRDEDLQVDPQNILCLTFTDSGVNAMRERLISLIASDAYKINIFTFHSFCNEIIKSYPEKFYLKSQIEDIEKTQLIESFIDKLDPSSDLKPFGNNYLYVKDLINMIISLKKENVSPEDFLNSVNRFDNFFQNNFHILESIAKAHAKDLTMKQCQSLVDKLISEDQAYLNIFIDYLNSSDKPKTFRDQVKKFFENAQKSLNKQKDSAIIYKNYRDYLEDHMLYDYEDMILKVIQTLLQNKNLLAEYQEKFQYILVDEYQDTNGSQNKILELITNFFIDKSNIFIVGDDDQSIFRFQGASLENLLQYAHRYNDQLTSITLTDNYRSQQNILDAAYNLIQNNSSRISRLIKNIDKRLRQASNHSLEPIKLIKTTNKIHQTLELGYQIKSLLESGVKPSEIAVIFRENKEAEEIIDIFSRMKIPFISQITDNILSVNNIAQLIDLLKVINDPLKNSALLFNLLNYDFIFKSREFKEKKISIRDVLELTLSRKEHNAQKAFIDWLLENEKFKDFAERIFEFNRLTKNLNLDKLLEKTINEFYYLEHILLKEDKYYQISCLQALFSKARQLMNSNGLVTKNVAKKINDKFCLNDFIEYLDLLETNNLAIAPTQSNSSRQGVELMTAHRSKGLEFEHVFIVSCQDGIWGNKRSIQKIKMPPLLLQQSEALLTGDPLEEERRLFYVAMTRAKKNLNLMYYQFKENSKEIQPAIFLQELESSNCIEKQTLEFDESQLQTLFAEKSSYEQIISEDFLQGLLKDYKLSVTHLNNYLDCPRKFFYQNLIRVPAAKNKHAALGTAVHQALYDLFSLLAQKNTNEKDSLKYLIDQFHLHLQDQKLIDTEFEECLYQGAKMLEDYHLSNYRSYITNTLLEFDFSAKFLDYGDLVITGKLDKIEIDSNGININVVDYKTGRPDPSEFKPGGKTHRQIVFYQLLCDLAKEKNLFKYQMVSGELDFLKKDGGKLRKQKIIVQTEDLKQLDNEIKSFSENLKKLNFPMTDENETCSRCDFKNICGR